MHIQPASREQAADLAYLINLAGEGLPEMLWAGLAENGTTPLETGALRATREEGGFSYRNARVCMEGHALLGMILAYRQPDPYDAGDLSELPEVVRPLVALEAEAPGSWYINAIATYEAFRGRGAGSLLMRDTEIRARAKGCGEMSLIVASENTTACSLYKHLGYREVKALPLIPYPGCTHGGDWVLMTKTV